MAVIIGVCVLCFLFVLYCIMDMSSRWSRMEEKWQKVDDTLKTTKQFDEVKYKCESCPECGSPYPLPHTVECSIGKAFE